MTNGAGVTSSNRIYVEKKSWPGISTSRNDEVGRSARMIPDGSSPARFGDDLHVGGSEHRRKPVSGQGFGQ